MYGRPKALHSREPPVTPSNENSIELEKVVERRSSRREALATKKKFYMNKTPVERRMPIIVDNGGKKRSFTERFSYSYAAVESRKSRLQTIVKKKMF